MRPLTGSTANVSSSVWELDVTSTFDNGYVAKDLENRRRVREAILTLTSSSHPQRLGELKDTPDGRVFVYDIGRKYRMSYCVSYSAKIIQLIRVCDHKTVYGRD